MARAAERERRRIVFFSPFCFGSREISPKNVRKTYTLAIQCNVMMYNNIILYYHYYLRTRFKKKNYVCPGVTAQHTHTH